MEAENPGSFGAMDIARFDRQVVDSPVPVLLTFGATWCPACRIVEASLAVLAAHYGDHLRVFGADIDQGAVQRLRSERLWQMGASFSVNLIPVTLLFNQGRVVRTLYGPIPATTLAREITPWLSKEAPAAPQAESVSVQLTRRFQESGEWVEMELTAGELAAVDREQAILPQVALNKAQRRGLGGEESF